LSESENEYVLLSDTKQYHFRGIFLARLFVLR